VDTKPESSGANAELSAKNTEIDHSADLTVIPLTELCEEIVEDPGSSNEWEDVDNLQNTASRGRV